MSSRIDFYERYYKNVSPTTFEVKRGGDKIIIEGFDKKYPKNFKPKDVKQYPVNQEKFSKGGLIAPNGRKSNLTAKQYKLVRTKQFKNWFGDWELNPNAASKVLDENGEPLVCYHSTDKKFTSFDSNYSFDGFWFTESKTKLLNQEAGAGGQGIIYDVFLNIRKIGDWDDYDKGLDMVKRDGYNGVKLDDDFLVFEPTQIKFANGSNTRFDPHNSDMRFNNGGKINNDEVIYTKEFKNWFGDWEKVSKNIEKLVDDGVIDEYDYEPRLPTIRDPKDSAKDISNPLYDGVSKVMRGRMPEEVYHGTGSHKEFTVFSRTGFGGYYFSNDKEVARTYGSNIFKVYLDIKNPIVYDFRTCESFDEAQTTVSQISYAVQEARDFNKDVTILRHGVPYIIPKDCDGIIFKNLNDVENQEYGNGLNDKDYIEWNEKNCSTIYVVYKSEQIKLTNGKNVKFDPNNPDIRYEEGGKTQNDMKEIKVGDSVIPYGYKFTLIISEGWKNVLGKNVWKGTSKNGNYQLAFVESGKDTIVKNNNSTYSEGGEIKVGKLLTNLEQAFKDKDFDKFNSISNEIHSISDNEGLNKKEYDKWDSIREKESKYQIEKFSSTYLEGGGKTKTWKNKYNSKYDHPKDESHSLKDISKETGVSKKGLQKIYNKGIGAWKTNIGSVRLKKDFSKNKNTKKYPRKSRIGKEQWAMARVYSAVMGGKAAKVDAKELKMNQGGIPKHIDNQYGVMFNTDYERPRLEFFIFKNINGELEGEHIGHSDSKMYLDDLKVLNLYDFTIFPKYDNEEARKEIIYFIKDKMKNYTGKTKLMINDTIQ